MASGEAADDPVESALAAVRRIALALPETNERLSHGAPCFFVRDKKTFVYFHDDHHGDGILGIWCAAPPGVQEQMVEAEPERYYRPRTWVIEAGSGSGSTSIVTTTNWPR